MGPKIREIGWQKYTPNFGTSPSPHIGDAKRKKDILNEVGEGLKYFHPKLKFTVEEEPSRFLDSEFVKTSDGMILKVRLLRLSRNIPTLVSPRGFVNETIKKSIFKI